MFKVKLVLFAILVLLNVSDYALTEKILSVNGSEVNPIMKYVIDDFGYSATAVVKGIALLFFGLMLTVIPVFWISMVVAVYSLVVVYSVFLLHMASPSTINLLVGFDISSYISKFLQFYSNLAL